jgi:hypothetical protein
MLQNPTFAQLINKTLVSRAVLMFIIMLTTARHWTLLGARSIRSVSLMSAVLKMAAFLDLRRVVW